MRTWCTFPDCGKKEVAIGLCSGHWQQQHAGKPLRPLQLVVLGTPEERLRAHTEVSGECLIWTGWTGPKGYGTMRFNGKCPPVHRVAYELANGPIPRGLVIDHKCYNPSCVRPDHLQAVTKKENAENRAGLDANNTSGVRGVYWDHRGNCWVGAVEHSGTKIHVGRFRDLREAERAVIAKRNELFTNNLLDRQRSEQS